LRLPEDEDDAPPPKRMARLKRKLGELWTSVEGI
jgi:cell volume regulation protein A